jgi:phage shock protein E
MNNTVLIVGIIIVLGILLTIYSNMQQATSAKNISAKEFTQRVEQERGVVIDVRTQQEYNEGHLALTDYNYDIMSGEFENQLDSLDKDETYYLYCRSGNRSGRAADLMKQKGFEKVYNIGGYGDLVNVGLKSER